MPRFFRRARTVCALAAWIAVASGSAAAFAAEPPDAARALFPAGSRFEATPVALDDDRLDRVRDRAGVRVRPSRIRAWRVAGGGDPGGWLFVDRVIGKHEFITYALAVGGDGRVSGLEILEYLESYGGEVRRPSWRAQFHGKRLTSDALALGEDIDNISGATLSSRNITDGVRKLLILREALLAAQGASGG